MAGNAYLHTGGELNRRSGGRAHPYAVHYTSHILELLLAFHYDWENETILPGALRRQDDRFQMISNMYGYFFVHITLHGFFSEF